MLRRFAILLILVAIVLGSTLLFGFAVITSKMGSPTLTLKGLVWKEIILSDTILENVQIDWNRTILIKSAMVDIELKEQTSDVISTGQWQDWITQIHIEQLQIHRNDQLISDNLTGTLYPIIALHNDWMSIEKEGGTWTLIATIDEETLDVKEHEFTGSGKCTVQSKELFGPWVGFVENIQLNHPIVGSNITIPKFDIELARNSMGWNARTGNSHSELLFSFDEYSWEINYSLSSKDLVEWFQSDIPNTKVSGYWNGKITSESAEIDMEGLGFEGHIYALHRLQTGQPITYKPIHSSTTKLLGPNQPDWVPYSELGWIAKTVVAGEDSPFYSHNGFNLEGLNRAINDLRKNPEYPIGGSSITQQVAKNIFTGNKPTLKRKVDEMIYTLALEESLSKEAIMSLYLNSIEFGEQIYGIQAASEQYFLKSPQFLSIKEAVFLAAILPNPRDGYRRAKLGNPPNPRMRSILQNLLDGKQINQQQFHQANNESLRLLLPLD